MDKRVLDGSVDLSVWCHFNCSALLLRDPPWTGLGWVAGGGRTAQSTGETNAKSLSSARPNRARAVTLLNFEDDLDGPQPVARPYTPPTRRRTHVLAQDLGNWRPLRDYVMGRIEDIHGPQVRDGLRESIIFKDFLRRWGAQAESIARYLMEDRAGWWNSRPVILVSFCKGADDYVARPIAERLP